jgi:hypothetical protein
MSKDAIKLNDIVQVTLKGRVVDFHDRDAGYSAPYITLTVDEGDDVTIPYPASGVSVQILESESSLYGDGCFYEDADGDVFRWEELAGSWTEFGGNEEDFDYPNRPLIKLVKEKK